MTVSGIGGGVIVVLIAAAILALVSPARRWFVSLWKTLQGFGAARRARKLKRLRALVVRSAIELGINVAVSSHGHRPEIITWSDGTTSSFFGDQQAYERSMRAGTTPLNTSYPFKGPVPISRWSEEKCRYWLNDHPAQIKTK